MSIAVERNVAPMAGTLPHAPVGQSIRFSAVTWDEYEAFGKLLADRPVRITFDRGELELMVSSEEHEAAKERLGRLVEMLTFVLRIPIRPRGSMTFQRQDIARGFEPDKCYWIVHEPQMRGRKYISAVDPPPDLTIEIEVSYSSINRLGLYAAPGIPEVWRWDLQDLRVMVLDAKGRYDESVTSLAFPFLPLHEFSRFLSIPDDTNETDWMWQFHDWVQSNAANWMRK